MSEEKALRDELQQIETFMRHPRFDFTKRHYSAADVAKLRGTLQLTPASHYTATKLYSLCRERFPKGQYVHTFGALDPVQVTQMAKHIECVYVSGWQCSSTASTTNEPGPDFADYPMDTVPQKVDQLFRAQNFHDAKQKEARSRMTPAQRADNLPVDYLRPIIADGDAGFGGTTSVMKMMKLQIQAGAAGVHIEDQKPGAKKCGHMGGKVLVPIREQINRLTAARLQADIMGAHTVIVARTDASSATFLDNNVDPRDHPFIAGATNPAAGNLNELIDAAEAAGKGAAAVEEIKQTFAKTAGLMRYTEVIGNAIKSSSLSVAQKASTLERWNRDSMRMSHPAARQLATQLGFGSVFWCWNAPRSQEGYFVSSGGTDYSVMRAIAMSPYSDLIWMETSSPDIQEAREFAEGVHVVCPHQMLAYNLSPSFNWDASGLSDEGISRFQDDLGKLGFTWHFITLAGFHANALKITELSRALQERGVIAYVQMIQREERRLGVECLTHQRWSGAAFADAMVEVATGGSISTASMGAGVTETQFQSKL